MNANFGLLDPLSEVVRDKQTKRERLAARSLAAMRAWVDQSAEVAAR
jgi:folate-dependent tRNA-U54 methylase TrmFO/GidA